MGEYIDRPVTFTVIYRYQLQLLRSLKILLFSSMVCVKRLQRKIDVAGFCSFVCFVS
jgi:hypothetical protein